jgi:hypothetical protein
MTQQQLTPLAQRMLGIICEATRPGKAEYIAAWQICDALGVDRSQLLCMTTPVTEYDNAFYELIDAYLVEEILDDYTRGRYRLKKGQ